jgi:hypothetical protein
MAVPISDYLSNDEFPGQVTRDALSPKGLRGANERVVLPGEAGESDISRQYAPQFDSPSFLDFFVEFDGAVSEHPGMFAKILVAGQVVYRDPLAF